MDPTLGREADAVAFLTALSRTPYRYDFYQTLRRLECLHADKPRWGRGLRPVDEPIRLGQDADLSFAPAPLASFDTSPQGVPRLRVRLFGLFGPNGPLPIHLTEYARERQRVADHTFSRFLDIFHHRFLALFYRAWAQTQPHVNRDRPRDDRFAGYVGSFIAMATPPVRDRDAVPDLARCFHVGSLIRHVRNVEGLTQILQHFFRIRVQVEEFVGHWMVLSTRELTRLGAANAALGAGAVAGRRVWDRQHKFRIALGPLSLKEYESFLPGGTPLGQLVDWVRTYFCFELDWDVRLLLKKKEVPALMLGRGQRLGWTTWLGRRRSPHDAGDLCLNAEVLAGTYGVKVA